MPEVMLEGRRLAIFPCWHNKRPSAGSHGFKDAVSDPEQVEKLFQRYPGAPLIGVPTGEINGIDVLDVDPRRGGHKFLQENKHRLPETRVHRTGGGLHLIFHHAPGLHGSCDRIAEGIEVKAQGNYVIWYPASVNPVYPVLYEAPVAEWPEWLLELAATPLVDKKEGGTSMIWRPSQANQELPRSLYLKVCELMLNSRGRDRRRVLGLLNTLVQKRENRNAALNSIGFCFRELIAAGVITRDAAMSLLIDAATLNGYITKRGLAKAIRTIHSGLGHQSIKVPPLSYLSAEEKAE
jgi:hypothetical protein